MELSTQTHGTTAVAWQEWGEDAFAQARREDKPILLDIGAVWCHWCHVMDDGIPGDPDHTGTYSDPAVQERIAQHFVAIKVDNDRRPDINARYNMGGWPSTVFLTPEGTTLYGETYVPPRRMIALLDHIQKLWTENRTELDAQLLEAQRPQEELKASSSDALDTHAAPSVMDALHGAWDYEFGGFVASSQFAPKFPHPAALSLLLEQYTRKSDPTVREMLVTTLRGMSGGGMYDHYAGGFFRYSTTRDWSVPHYEKMLEDNAKLIPVYVQASQTLGMPEFLSTALDAQKFLLTDLLGPSHSAFSGSQDADAEEAYYGQTLAERAKLPTPFIDRTVYCDWNCLAVSALVRVYQATGDATARDTARQTFAFIQSHLARPSDSSEDALALSHFYADGKTQGTVGLLADQTAFLRAALDLNEITGDTSGRQIAAQAGNFISHHLQDSAHGGFYDLPLDQAGIGALSTPRKDMSDNSDAALALLRLSLVSGDTRYRDAGERALRTFTEEYGQMSFFAASYARAVDAYARPPIHVILVGLDTAGLAEMQRLAWLAPLPGKCVETLSLAEAQAGSFPGADDGTARAYVCVRTACQMADTPQVLAALLSHAHSA